MHVFPYPSSLAASTDHCRSAVTVSKRENFAVVWEALSTYEKAANHKLALGLDWEIPETCDAACAHWASSRTVRTLA